MASVKIKFRQSSVNGREGTLFYQIIHNRQVRQIYTDIHIYNNEWDAERSVIIILSDTDTDRAKYLESANITMREGLSRLAAIISGLESKGLPYTAGEAVAAFNSPLTVVGVVSFTRRLVSDMRKIGKRSAAKRFDISLNSLLRYTGGSEVAWDDMSSTFVLGYEEFLARRGLCRNSTSFYMRNLRAIMNRAAEHGFPIPCNLFRHVYMGVDRTVKRGVSLDTICRIRDMDLDGHPSLDFARNIFMFSFYTRGMSFVDMAFLKKGDMSCGVITYMRSKTRRQLQVKVEPETSRIMERLGECGSSYLLPIITDDNCDERHQYENAYSRVNRNIQKIGIMLNLKAKLTLYVARHAWASIAHANNVSLGTISKAMGHDSESTTLIYLRSLDTTSVDKANSDIIKMMGKKRKKE